MTDCAAASYPACSFYWFKLTMQFFGWLIRLAFFGLVLWFALKNTVPVPLHLTESWRWNDVPLIVIMLGCFIVGVLAGAFALAPRMFRLRRQLAALNQRPREGEVAKTATAAFPNDRLADVARDAGAAGQLEADTRYPRYPN